MTINKHFKSRPERLKYSKCMNFSLSGLDLKSLFMVTGAYYESSLLYRVVLYYIISYCIALHCTVLYCINLLIISRVRGPYGKLWTKFFPSFYGPSAKRAGHQNKKGENENP